MTLPMPVLLAWMILQTTGAPAEPAPVAVDRVVDMLQLESRYESLPGPGDGGSGAVEWWRQRPAATTIFGVSHTDLAGARWTAGRVGYVHRSGLTILEGDLRAGPGERAGSAFTYLMIRASWTRVVARSRLLLQIAGQHVELEPFAGTDLRLGLQVLPIDGWEVGISAVGSVDGDLDTALGIARVDRVRPDGSGWFLGLTSGRSAPERFDLVVDGSATTSADVEEAFAGLRFRWGSYQLTLVGSHLWTGDLERTSLALHHRITL